MMPVVTSDMQIRHLPGNLLNQLSEMLDNNESWKKLMEIIPKRLKEGERLQYTNEDMRKIDELSKIESPTKRLLDEWGTTGKKDDETRPTVKHLLELLVKAGLFRAADFLATDVLYMEKPARPLIGPGARVDITLRMQNESDCNIDRSTDNNISLRKSIPSGSDQSSDPRGSEHVANKSTVSSATAVSSGRATESSMIIDGSESIIPIPDISQLLNNHAEPTSFTHDINSAFERMQLLSSLNNTTSASINQENLNQSDNVPNLPIFIGNRG